MSTSTPTTPVNTSRVPSTPKTIRWNRHIGESIDVKDPSEQRESRDVVTPTEEQCVTHPSGALSIDSVDEFFYGYRYVQQYNNGREAWDRVPLTMDDLMYPQLEDREVQSCEHSAAGNELYNKIYTHVAGIPGMHVLWDVLVNWGIEDQKNLAPDILILTGVKEKPQQEQGAYDRAKYGGYPLVSLELTSRSTRYMDVNTESLDYSKYVQYQHIGVSYYLVVDVARQRKHHPPDMWGYRLERGLYRPIRPDQHGRLWIAPLNVSLGPHRNRADWFDAHGSPFLSHLEEKARANHADQRAEQAEKRVEQETQARLAAEEELRQLKAKLGLL